MAITYPRTLPSWFQIFSGGLRLIRTTSSAATKGGSMIVTEQAEPYWVAEYYLPPLSADEGADLQAWWDSLGEGLKTFLAREFKHVCPRSYLPDDFLSLTRAGGGAFDGTAALSARSVSSLTVGKSGGYLPAELVFLAGDLVGLENGASPKQYSLHRVIEDAAADGSGVAVLSVVPPVPVSLFPVDCTVRLLRPAAEMVPDPGSFSYTPEGGPASASFTARSKVF